MREQAITTRLDVLEAAVAKLRRDTILDLMAACLRALKSHAKVGGVLVLALLATGCAGLRPIARVDNPRLQAEGIIAVRGVQLVDAIRAAQRSLEPMVDTKVLTAAEALKVAKVFGDALEAARRLVTLLQFADSARDAAERLAALKRVGADWRDMLRGLSGATVGVSSETGRAAVAGVTGGVTDALADLVPEIGGAR